MAGLNIQVNQNLVPGEAVKGTGRNSEVSKPKMAFAVKVNLIQAGKESIWYYGLF